MAFKGKPSAVLSPGEDSGSKPDFQVHSMGSLDFCSSGSRQSYVVRERRRKNAVLTLMVILTILFELNGDTWVEIEA